MSPSALSPTRTTSFSLLALCALVLLYSTLLSGPLHVPPRNQPVRLCTPPSFEGNTDIARQRWQLYDKQTTLSLLRESTRDQQIVFMGDSTLRHTFYTFAELMRRTPTSRLTQQQASLSDAELAKRETQRHADTTLRVGSSTLQFLWRPFLTNITQELQRISSNPASKPSLIVASAGLWDLLHHGDSADAKSPVATPRILADLAQLHAVTRSTTLQLTAYRDPVEKTQVYKQAQMLWIASPMLRDAQLSGHRQQATHFRNANVRELNSKISDALLSTSPEDAATAAAAASKHTSAAALTALADSSHPQLAFANSHDTVAQRDQEFKDDGIHSQYLSQQLATSVAACVTCTLRPQPFSVTPGQLVLLIAYLVMCAVLLYQVLYQSVSRLLNHNQGYRSVVGDDLELGTSNTAITASVKKHENALIGGAVGDLANAANASGQHGNNGAPLQQQQQQLVSHPSSGGNNNNATPTVNPVLLTWFQLFTILLFTYMMDSNHRLSVYLIGDKTYIRDTFIFICLCIMLLAGQSKRATHKNDASILNRDQTEEWKGFMQLLFVLYHFFAAKELYNVIRILIAAYVWMTGYNNFSFFKKYADYGMIRLVKMLFRLNFFVALVCITMEREYMQYYVCALHTFFFLVVYAHMAIMHQHNKSNSFLAMKFVALFVVLFVLFDLPQLGLFRLIFSPFPLFYWNNSMHEWIFRSTLDHYATFFGMLCAWHVERLEHALQWLETAPIAASYRYKRMTWYAVLIGVLSTVTYLWYTNCLLLPKSAYNAQNAYTSIIPIVVYIIARNCHSKLRVSVLGLFAWFGKITLETYTLQFHIWLSDDAATIIHYTNDAYPLLNFCLTSAIYIGLSYQVWHCTNVISEWCIEKGCTNRQLIDKIARSSMLWMAALCAAKMMLFTVYG